MTPTDRTSHQNDLERETVYDFNSERVFLMVLGGFSFLKEPRVKRILSIIHFCFFIVMYGFLIVMAVISMVMFSDEKELTVEIFLLLALMFLTYALISTRHISESDLANIVLLLKKGVFTYEKDRFSEDYRRIKVKRVGQLRFVVSLFTKYCLFSAAFNTLFVPLEQLFASAKGTDNGDSVLNPYLPLPFYLPFETRSTVGFGLTFAFEALFMLLLFVTYVCSEEIYLCLSLQLYAQLEILNYSIKNIEKRAQFKFMKSGNKYEGYHQSTGYLFEREEFQECMFMCLRENIVHYQVLLRFSKLMSTYMDFTTFYVIVIYSILMASEVLAFLENPRANAGLFITFISDIFGSLQMMYVGQMIADKSAELMTSFYSTPWPECNKHFKTLLNITIARTQQPIYIQAKFLKIRSSLETFADLVSLGYRLMNIIR